MGQGPALIYSWIEVFLHPAAWHFQGIVDRGAWPTRQFSATAFAWTNRERQEVGNSAATTEDVSF
jgi:hypothetical protein